MLFHCNEREVVGMFSNDLIKKDHDHATEKSKPPLSMPTFFLCLGEKFLPEPKLSDQRVHLHKFYCGVD